MASQAATNPSASADGKNAPTIGGLALTHRIASVCLLVLTAIALLLRALHLTSRSFTLDDGFSVYLARSSPSQFVRALWDGELNMALYYAVLSLWTHFSLSEFWIRLLSVVFGVATVPVIYLLGLRLFGRRAAIVAALLIALHPAHVALSQDARSYSLTVLLVSLSSLLFLRMLRQPSFLNGGGYAVVTALAIYSHFFAALLVFAQAFALLFTAIDKRVGKQLINAAVLLALLLAPVAIFFASVPRLELAWVPAMSARQLLYLLYFLTLSKFRCLTYVVLWAAAIWAAISQRRSGNAAWPYRFVLSLLVVPVTITITASVMRPLLVERFLAICIPASVLLAAAGFDYLLDHSRSIAAGALLLLVLYSARSLRFFYAHPDINDDWRSATHYILANARPNDEVVVLPGYAHFTVDYYRYIAGPGIPEVHMAASDALGLERSFSDNVWIVSSNFPEARLSEAQVETFLNTRRDYCGQSPAHFTNVKIWQLRRCKPKGETIPPLSPGPVSSPTQ